MSQKNKGTNAERELIHKFWSQGNWAAVRSAGSGSMIYPSPDIIASNGRLTIAIECKSSKSSYIYLTKKEISELRSYSMISNSMPFIGARFSRKEWSFLKLSDLKETQKNFVISENLAKEKGITFSDLLKVTLDEYKP